MPISRFHSLGAAYLILTSCLRVGGLQPDYICIRLTMYIYICTSCTEQMLTLNSLAHQSVLTTLSLRSPGLSSGERSLSLIVASKKQRYKVVLINSIFIYLPDTAMQYSSSTLSNPSITICDFGRLSNPSSVPYYIYSDTIPILKNNGDYTLESDDGITDSTG